MRWPRIRVAVIAAPLYQQSYYAYVVDGLRAAAARRWSALAYVAVLLTPPIALIGAGSSVFGSTWSFALGGLLITIALEFRGARVRGSRLSPTATFVAPSASAFGPILVLIAELAFPFVVWQVDSSSHSWAGFLWGIALAGVLDGLRQAVAIRLAYRFGKPLYERAFRWINQTWEIEATRPLIRLDLAELRTAAEEFSEWAPELGATFVAVEWQGDPEWNEQALFVYDGKQIWAGTSRFALPLDKLPRNTAASATPRLRSPFGQGQRRMRRS